MALNAFKVPRRAPGFLPGSGTNWKMEQENIDPRTGKPRKSRSGLGSRTTTNQPGGQNQSSVGRTGRDAGTPGQGGQYDPASSALGGNRSPATLPSRSPTSVGSVASQNSVAEGSTLPGALGTLEPHGQQIAAADPTSLYGQILPGGSAGPAAGYFGAMFDPRALAAAGAGTGQLIQSNEDYLTTGQALAEEFTGGAGAGKFLNPVEMMNNIVSYAQMVMDSTQAGNTPWAGGPLAALADMQPGEALDAFVGIVQGAMASTMPEDVAAAYAAMLRRVGQTYVDQSYQTPLGDEQKTGMDVITFLQQQLGPNMGLAGGNSTGQGLSLEQARAAF